MKAWQIERYGTTAEMNYTTTRIPVLRSPDDILIKVHAASVNPIDTRMLGVSQNTSHVMMMSWGVGCFGP